MLIDWFTVGAQLVNFMILLWLLKRFLYAPIINAIDVREKKIAKELADAAAKKLDAQKERDEFLRKNSEFDKQRDDLMQGAAAEAQEERQRLLDDAQKAADTLTAKRKETLKSDAEHLSQSLKRRIQEEVFSVARKTLADLTGTSFEDRVYLRFLQRLKEITAHNQKTGNLRDSDFKGESTLTTVRSAFEMSEEQRANVTQAIAEYLGDKKVGNGISFEVAPALIGGIEFHRDGQRVAWSIDSYLTALEKDVEDLIGGTMRAGTKKSGGATEAASDRKVSTHVN